MKSFDFFRLFVPVCLICCCLSCKDNNEMPVQDDAQEEEVMISCTVNDIVYDASGGMQTFSFSTNMEWSLKVLGNVTWCAVSSLSGGEGTHNINVSVESNNTNMDRNVTLVILCGDKSCTIGVTQKQKNAFILNVDEEKTIEVGANGGEIEIEVKTNVDYEMDIIGGAAQWIKEVKPRSMLSYLHVFSIDLNKDTASRNGVIQFKTSETVYSVQIVQDGASSIPVLNLDKNRYVVSNLGETITVEVEGNVDFGVKMPDVTWIQTKGNVRSLTKHTLDFVILPNDTYNERSAEIIVYDKNSDLKETLLIVQEQNDLLEVQNKYYELESKKATIEIEIEANINFETLVDVDWMTLVKQVKVSSTKQILYFEVGENLKAQDRSGQVVLVNKEKEMKQTIVVLQKMKEKEQSGDKSPEGNVDDMTWG